MKRKIYAPAVRAKIIQAAKSARASGKTWKVALEAAKKAGYTGTADGLYQMARKAKPTASKKPAAAKPKAKRRGRKPGPKPGSRRDPITAFVEKLVEQRLKERVRKAIRALKGI